MTKVVEPIELDDYRSLPEAAPIAASIDATAATRTAFDAADGRAIDQQTTYRRLVRLMLGVSLVGALASALALLPDGWWWLPPAGAIGAIQLLALLLTFAIMGWIKLRGLSTKWLNARTDAEQLRSKVFEEIVTEPVPAGSDGRAVQTTKLDALQRCHVLSQQKWLIKRATKHKEAADGWGWSKTIAVLLVLAVAVLAVPMIAATLARMGFTWPWLKSVAATFDIADGDRIRLATTAALQALMGFNAALTEVDQDRRKANLYRATAKRLDRLMDEDLAAVEADCERGGGEALLRYFRSARTVLEADHFAWNVLDPDESTGVKVGGGAGGA